MFSYNDKIQLFECPCEVWKSFKHCIVLENWFDAFCILDLDDQEIVLIENVNMVPYTSKCVENDGDIYYWLCIELDHEMEQLLVVAW